MDDASYHDVIYSRRGNDFLTFSQSEDYRGNLSKYIKTNFEWKNKNVLEAGIGFGRTTDNYICDIANLTATDKSVAMIEFCKNKYSLKGYKNIRYLVCEHERLPQSINESYDIFISSYSLCYVANSTKNKKDLKLAMDKIFSLNCQQFIVIENTGIFSAEDEYLQPYYNYFDYLNSKFKHFEIRSDFQFKSNQEAEIFSKMFFGEKIGNMVKSSGSNIVPEKTCIWYK